MSRLTVSRFSSLRGKWGACVGIALVVISFALFSEAHVRYERQDFFFTEPWRLLTAHLTHLSALHLLFNLVGLVLICELLWHEMPVRHGLAVMLVASGVIDLLLWRWHPEVLWYVGSSGVLHALWAACVTFTLSHERSLGEAKYRLAALVGGALLFVKLTLERMDILFSAVAPDDFLVIDVVHVYGALTGVGYVLIWRQVQRVGRRK